MHTPGPWQVGHEHNSGYAAPTIWGNNRIIAQVLYFGGSEDREVDPNARLIASAPDLLAELENTRDWVKDLLTYTDEGRLSACINITTLSRRLGSVERVIDRAKGG